MPTLAAGDVVLVDKRLRPHAGDVVVAVHPTKPDLRVVKRTLKVDASRCHLVSDNPTAPGAADSETFGPIELSAIIGCVTSVIGSALRAWATWLELSAAMLLMRVLGRCGSFSRRIR